MAWVVYFRTAAEKDIEAVRTRYEKIRPGLGDEYLDEIGKIVRELSANPEWRPFYYRDFRRVLLRRFPYKVFYKTDTPRVIVFRVLHGRRHHQRRLPRKELRVHEVASDWKR